MNELTLSELKVTAREYVQNLSSTAIPDLYGTTDGKAVGTYVEHGFHDFLETKFTHSPGSSASGIDFPALDVDLKVTSVRQPQSSCPFRDASQKVYGLGYHLLVLIYEKTDDHQSRTARLSFHHALFIAKGRTADYQTTYGLREILRRRGNKDDVVAFLEERNLPLDEIGRSALADRIISDPPDQGYLTISNALQWRLQYSRVAAIASESTDASVDGVENLLD